MHSYLFESHHDLITPDGVITKINEGTPTDREATVEIRGISPSYAGFKIDPTQVHFNFKSTLAQLGLDAHAEKIELSKELLSAKIHLHLKALDQTGEVLLKCLTPGAHVGKLFAADASRKVQNPDYLERCFGRTDRNGSPLLSLGGVRGHEDLDLQQIGGRLIGFLPLMQGRYIYDSSINGFLPTLAKALHNPNYKLREMLKLHQIWQNNAPKTLSKEHVLLVRTAPLHILTCFARVATELLPEGFHHTSASVLQPDTQASGDVYELYGTSTTEIERIPLEFYTLEPYREHVSFDDRDQLRSCLDDPSAIFKAYKTAKAPPNHKAAVFIVKGTQLQNLKSEDWIYQDPHKSELPGIFHTERQALLAERYIHGQPAYPFLKAIEDGLITSQGILLSRTFPSPFMKRMLLSERVQRCLKGIYFHLPSHDGGEYFSHEDRAFLLDLAKFGIPTYWADNRSGKLLQYIPKPDKDTGMFVPKESIDDFVAATFVGIYGSNLIEGNFEGELKKLLEGLLSMRESVNHPLLSPGKPLAMVTGGGPGAMSVGNRAARELGILSCANIVDFTSQGGAVVNEQHQNPYVDIKMTYRLDKLVERQAEFYLDLPIFLTGGIGTDFEYSLEEVRRKTGVCTTTPILLFGTPEYWRDKVKTRFMRNLASGTIKGSEWVSNCFFCVQTAEQGLEIYRNFFTGQLKIGKGGPVYEDGFVSF
ncbi:MAG: hypothetical protein H7A40_06575 [Chlamydiales bacterium]|nr:hypothetical protein [Chlamydiales bacterium]